MLPRSHPLQTLGALALLGGVLALFAGCDQLLGSSGLGQAACPEMGPGKDVLGASFAANAVVNGKIRTFVQAADDLSGVGAAIEAEVSQACLRMGADLGLPPAALAFRDEPGGRASGPCAAVSARIDGILRQGMAVQVSVVPPTCQASAQAEAHCAGACDASVDPGQIVATCQPARLSGFCQGRCVGRCEGRCNGQCNGQCSAVDAQGRCVGQCNGECAGGCDATCHARCEGQWQAPQCEGSVRPPSADAECNASCRAHASVNASCSAPQVLVRPMAGTPDALRLAATLQANLPALVHAEIALGRRVIGDAQIVGQVGANLPRIVGQAGFHALACVGAATQATAHASAQINVSVQASASVTGKVGASGG